MKKKLLIITSLIFILILSGCSTQPNKTESIEATNEITEKPEIVEKENEKPKEELTIGYTKNGDDLHITESGTKIKGMAIKGDLYIDESVGDGEFYIEDVIVDGTIFINGGGPNSGYFINVVGKRLIVESKTNPNLVLDLNTSIEGIQIASDCRIESQGENTKSVTINNKKTSDAVNILLKGNYPKVSLESTANVKIDGSVSLMSVLKNANLSNINMVDTSKMYFFSSYGKSVTINGGTIVEAWINAEYCSLPSNTETIKSEVGITNVTVGSKDIEIISNNTEEESKSETTEASTDNQDTNSKTTNETEDNSASETTENEQNKETEPSNTTEQETPDIETTETTEATENEENAQNEEAKPSDTTEQETTNNENFNLPLIVEGYPKVTKNMPNITINVKANRACTLYILVEADMVFEKGSSPEKVRDGISAGKGLIMGDMPYIVIHDSFNVQGTNNIETFNVNTMDYMPEENNDMSEEDGPPPEDDDNIVYTFIVFEDENGELSVLYSF
jgi:flagellar biosynthesis GTPase FlhF